MNYEDSVNRKGGTDSEEDTVTCPMCGANVPDDAEECPDCGEPFMPEAIETKKKDKEPKLLFWIGLILVIAGGPGVALGSWLHDLLRVPISNYDNFDSFGWVNQLVATIGIIILVIGIIFLILSLSKMERQDLKDMEVNDTKKDEEQGG